VQDEVRNQAELDALKSTRFELENSLEAIEDELYEKGCTDGLPIIPPTPERVARMIAYNHLDPQQVIAAKIAPQNGEATVEKIAINAVMAGCRPEHLPVVIAAVEAMTADGFDLFGVQATTHPCGMLVLVNGPIAKTLDINSGSGAMGPCWRANATIGRAVRLILLNLGGAHPGKVDKATQGTPAKFSFCFAENEESSPWMPFHVERGFKPTDSTVTVLGLEGPHDINGQDASKAASFLRILASSIVSAGSSNFRFTVGSDLMICLGPEHAAILGREGVKKEDVRDYLFKHARVPLHMVSEEHLAARKRAPKQHGDFDGVSPIPVVLEKRNILITVVGGSGLHSSWMPSWGGPKHRAVTRLIRMPEARRERFDVAVIGQGYAGLTAAKLANDKGLRTANFEAEVMGGLIVNLNHLDPAPPEPENAGFELASNFAMRNMEAGVVPVSDPVTRVERSESGSWMVQTESATYEATNIVVASGARLRKLGVPGEEEYQGQGVSECADCDGPLYKDMETVVIGGGDSAFQEALILAESASKVSIIMRGKAPRARKDFLDRAAANPKIVQVFNTRVLAIQGEPKKGVHSIRIETAGGRQADLPCMGVFIFVGLEPNTGFLPDDAKRDKHGALVTSHECATSLPGLWAIGAVRSGFGGLLTDAGVDATRAVAVLPAKEVAVAATT
jgi:thioredoxin reductase